MGKGDWELSYRTVSVFVTVCLMVTLAIGFAFKQPSLAGMGEKNQLCRWIRKTLSLICGRDFITPKKKQK